MSANQMVPANASRVLLMRVAYAFATGLLTAALVHWVDLSAAMGSESSSSTTAAFAILLFVLGAVAGFVSLFMLDLLLWLSGRTSGFAISLRAAARSVSSAIWPLLVAVLVACLTVVVTEPASPVAQFLPATTVVLAFATHVVLIFRRAGAFTDATKAQRVTTALVYACVPFVIIAVRELAR